MVNKKSFLDILMTYSPEELNEFIHNKGKSHKMVNAITFLDDDKNELRENIKCFTPEPDNPYPLCIGLGNPECEDCQLRAGWEPDDPYSVGA